MTHAELELADFINCMPCHHTLK